MTKPHLMILVLSLLLSACEKPMEPPAPPRPALVIVAGETDLNQSMVLVGEVKSRYESNQAFRISGKIIERKVEIGAQVKKGQVLARLDAADSRFNVAAATADVRATEANYALAKSEVERQRQLVSKRFITASALDKYEAELKTAEARVNQAKAQAAVSGNQSLYTTLVADRDGVITQIRAEPGQVVEAGEVIAQVVDTRQVEVLVAVPESRMANVKVGKQAMINLWADRSNTYQGTVREIAPAADSTTRTFNVRVKFDMPDDKVLLGMTAGVRFADITDAEIVVPNSAVTQKNGQTLVWVVDKSSIANPRPVTIGDFTEQGVAIKQGVQTGEMIAIVGVHTLIRGQRVIPQIQQVRQ
ncbi:MAG TPA: efflux RND transporter periplasmic adaptor subunit [Methylophilus sp.]|nr:efflux RND transporter periplasmic adaptor subunit [Methylophilus sp.]HQQ33000.1 efflux RND transporter periplasmic adaptor subunit [Methylophilus sp.]